MHQNGPDANVGICMFKNGYDDDDDDEDCDYEYDDDYYDDYD